MAARPSKKRVASVGRMRNHASMNTATDSFIPSRDFARIARAVNFIGERWRDQPRLETIAKHAGLSVFHFSRLFRRWAGVAPKQYLAHVTAHAARSALDAERSVLHAAHEVGLSGPSRLHDLMVVVEGVTPGEIKSGGAGVTLRHGQTNSPFGRICVASSARGVVALEFVDDDGSFLARLHEAWPAATFVRDDAAAGALAERLWGGGSDSSPLRLSVRGTNFELAVWRALLEASARGEMTTYGALARAVGKPDGARAVGNAVGANPIAWVIPCHRVLRTNGALGGYRWGVERKRAILAWEQLQRKGEA